MTGTIDEKALFAASNVYHDYVNSSNYPGKTLEAVREIIKAYESAKAAQPQQCEIMLGSAWSNDKTKQIPVPTEEELEELVNKKWKEVKPSKEAQAIRSKLSFDIDSGKYSQQDSDFMPDYVWVIVDIAAETALRSPVREYVEDGFSYDDKNRPYAFLQWKGTDACFDFHCECGAHCHWDGFFAYTVKCPHCNTIWEMPFNLFPRKVCDKTFEHWRGNPQVMEPDEDMPPITNVEDCQTEGK